MLAGQIPFLITGIVVGVFYLIALIGGLSEWEYTHRSRYFDTVAKRIFFTYAAGLALGKFLFTSRIKPEAPPMPLNISITPVITKQQLIKTLINQGDEDEQPPKT